MSPGEPRSALEHRDELTSLITTLHETQQRIFELTGGNVDAVTHPSGSSYLLQSAQQELREREKIQRRFAIERAAILDSLNAHIALLDSQGNITAVNQAWRNFADAQMLGWQNHGIGQNYFEIWEASLGLQSEETAQIANGIRSVLAREVKLFSHDYSRHSPHTQQWFNLAVTPLNDDELGGCVVRHFDITERKRSLQLLQESEARFRAVARATSDVIWDWDLTTDRIWWSDALSQVCGYTAEEIVAAPEWRLNRIHPDDRARFIQSIHAAIRQNQELWTCDYRFLHKDGSVLEIADRGLLVMEKDGRRTRFVGGMRDVTANKYALDRLAQQGVLLNEVQDAILLTGLEGEIKFWNQSAERIYGWTAAEVVGQSSIILYNDDLKERDRIAAEILAHGRWVGQLEHFKKDGTTIFMECRCSVLHDAEGRPHGFISINTDITERLKLEEENRQLQRLESIGQLTGGIAHDFNNLLTIVIGNAEALMENLPEDDGLRALAETAMEAAERGAELTSRLLAFARRQPLDPQPTDVNKLVWRMCDMLRRTLGQLINVRTNCPEGLWNALIDAPQLESAILNLSINARDAMPEGGTLTIETENISFGLNDGPEIKPGNYIMIAITDTGTGMTPEVLSRVFEPFFTTKDVGKGSGLGLSMVFGFIKQSKGHIHIQSEVGTGTCIKLYLPKADILAKSPTQKIGGLSIPKGSETILYVEDDEQVRKSVAAQLKSLGYKVVNASNCFEAIGLLEQAENFDLLFTDIMMPGGMNGRELAAHARELRPSLPILFVSGFSADAAAQHGTQLLSKPFRMGDLARKIRQVLDMAPATKQAV